MFNDKLTKSVAEAAMKCMVDQQKELEESKYIETKDKEGKMKSWKYEGDWEDSKEKKEGRGKVTHMSDAARRASEKMKKDDENVKEEVELTESELEEMSGAGWSAQKVHGHLKKSGWTLARTGGGHDVFTHPKAKNHIAVPRHKGDLKAPLVQGILKTVKMTTEAVEQIDEISDKTLINYLTKVDDDSRKGSTNEEVELDEEQLDEISKETLGSYIRKASGDRASATRAAGVEAGARGPNRWARMDAKEKRAEKRAVGISKAVTRLTKEELEEGLFPGTPEYEKKFGKVPQEMKQGQKKKTHQGEMEKTGKGVVHRRKFNEMIELFRTEGLCELLEQFNIVYEELSDEVDQLDETKEKEQLDELSKDKLGWYLRKASKHMDKKGENMIKRDKKFNPGYNKLSREIGGVSQRMASIAQASRKYMKKEEVEPETKEKECLVNDKNKGIGSFKKCQVERPDADFM